MHTLRVIQPQLLCVYWKICEYIELGICFEYYTQEDAFRLSQAKEKKNPQFFKYKASEDLFGLESLTKKWILNQTEVSYVLMFLYDKVEMAGGGNNIIAMIDMLVQD